MKKKYIIVILVGIFLIAFILISLGYYLGIIPKKKYYNSDFDIPPYISSTDQDEDGIDDQTDILENAKKYVNTEPKYKSQYYATGYPNDGYGVCTDVVAFALLDSGYDLMELVNQDIRANRSDYDIEIIDKKIDFRRVRNLIVYFSHTAISLTTDLDEIEEWQGGDIVVFPNHIGIVSDARNRKGIPYVIHHANSYQLHYEEDILERQKIVGHFRIS